MTFKNLCYSLMVFSALSIFISCGDDDGNNNNTEKGTVKFEITDAPIDDASIKSAFVTVAEIKVDGKSLEGFNKTTIDVLAYQNGETKLLTNADLEAKSYSEITLVLDYEKDENGDAPGCYIEEKENNKKHKLDSESNEITMNHDLLVEAESQSEIVLDFDLRKCIKREENGSDDYEFVSKSEFESGIRVVSKNEVGVIQGNCSDVVSNSDKVVVYAYKKGEYNRETEVQGQGQSDIEFSNAVTSSTLDANGDFELHFLEEGDYELHYCGYEEDSNGDMVLKGTLAVDVLGSINLNSISVDASSTVTVDVLVTGFLPI